MQIILLLGIQGGYDSATSASDGEFLSRKSFHQGSLSVVFNELSPIRPEKGNGQRCLDELRLPTNLGQHAHETVSQKN